MATTLFLGKATTAGPSGTQRPLLVSRDTSEVGANVLCSAGANHLPWLSGGTPTTWWYQVNAVTISGTISFNWWGLEGAMTTNAQPACRIARTDSAGTEISDVVANANAGHADGVEFGTAEALATWTATPTSTTFNAGDWIKVEPHIDAIGTMAAGTGTFGFGGASAGVAGDTFVQFTETITAYVAPTANPAYRNPVVQLLAH